MFSKSHHFISTISVTKWLMEDIFLFWGVFFPIKATQKLSSITLNSPSLHLEDRFVA